MSFPDLLLVAAVLSAAALVYQVKVNVNWGVLSAHRWDLEDKRISPLSFLVASSLHMFFEPIIAISLSLPLNYAVLRWNWESFLAFFLFVVLTTIVVLQFGRTVSACTRSFFVMSTIFNIFVFLGFIMSGSFVNPSKISVGFRWIMFMLPIFWGNAGAILTMFQYTDLGEQPCQSLASCIVYDPNYMAYMTGFPVLTTARKAMFVLTGMFLILVLIEYILLCRTVVQRSDYTIRSDSKTNSIVDKEEENDETNIECFKLPTDRSKTAKTAASIDEEQNGVMG